MGLPIANRRLPICRPDRSSLLRLLHWAMPLFLLALAAAVAAAGDDPRIPGGAGRFHDKPDPNSSGGIRGSVDPIENLEEVIVVEAETYRVYLATIERSQGHFVIRGLPPGKYSLLLKFRSTIVEGLQLDVPGGYAKIREKDWKYIQWETWRSDDFWNEKRIARMGGNGKRIKMIVEQVRDKKTYEPSGNILKGVFRRRIELTEMRKTGLVWQIKKTRHLYREERKIDAPGRKLKYVYAPKLGGIRVGDEMVELPLIEARQIGVPRPAHFRAAFHRERRGHHIKKPPL